MTTNEILTLGCAILAILISIFSYNKADQALKNGIREKVFEEQLCSIKKLYSLMVRFSHYIDFNPPEFFKEKTLNLNDLEKKEKLVHLYNEYYSIYFETELFIENNIKDRFHNLMYKMQIIIELQNYNLDNPNFINAKNKFFDEYDIVLEILKNELFILKSINENENINK